MIVLSGADLVLPDGVQVEGTLVIEGDRISVVTSAVATPAGAERVNLAGHLIVPGFVDVHVHGVEGVDTLDGPDAVAAIASRLPRFGVTAFCPTTVACHPETLRVALDSIVQLRTSPVRGARVLPAHLESNFINPAYCGAQPIECLRLPADGGDLLAELDRAGEHVGVVTLAPELDGAAALIERLVRDGRRVSLGHSGATAETALAAIAAGATRATHLFNRMPPLHHREPGLAGAVLASPHVTAEVIGDGVHVHPAMVRMSVAAKGAGRVMAITDAVAAAGLPPGATAKLGGRRIRVERSAAYLDDGTLAGSVATMDRVFGVLMNDVGLSLGEAVQLCATTPARALGRNDLGAIAPGALADIVVLDRQYRVRRTYVGGRLVYSV